MIRVGIFLLISMMLGVVNGQSQAQRIYLLPGQGSDHRLFSKLTFPEGYEIIHITYPVPDEGESMQQYARRIAEQIEEDEGFILIGVSLGGMLSSEIATIKSPDKTIIISSAKCQSELPKRYTFQRKVPINNLVGPGLSKSGALILQPIVEPDRRHEKEIFKSMLKDKDPIFLKEAIGMIVNWDKTDCDQEIYHIHGTQDRTVPIRNVTSDIVIENGSHMMTLTRPEDVSAALATILGQ